MPFSAAARFLATRFDDYVTFTDVQSSDWFYGDVMAAANGYQG